MSIKKENKGKYLVFIATVIIFLLVSAIASAQKGKQTDNGIYNYENQIQSESYGSFGDSLRMFVSLLVVLALIIGSVFLLKKLPIYKSNNKTKQSVSLIYNHSLGNKRSVCVLKFANEILLLGLTSTNISLLSKMDINEFYSSETLIDLDSQKSLNDNQSFIGHLKKIINKSQYE
jgi:flagellar biogenesis protein FliO